MSRGQGKHVIQNHHRHAKPGKRRRLLPVFLAALVILVVSLVTTSGSHGDSFALAAVARSPQHTHITHATHTAAPSGRLLFFRQHPVAAALDTYYAVQAGQSLSGISQAFYGTAGYWPFLAQVNHIASPWDIYRGQLLTIPVHPRYVAPPAEPATGLGTYTRSYNSQSVAVGGPWPGGAFGACVIRQESGGQPQVWNPDGKHWGLYQFAYETWVEYGGNPSSYGNAPASVQEQVFLNALAKGGQSNWSASDGC